MAITHRRYLAYGILSVVILLVLLALPTVSPTQAAPQSCSGLFFSEYIEGSNLEKAVEIYNGTGAAIDLSQYAVRIYRNGSSSYDRTIPLSGTLADNDVFVVANNGATFANDADLTSNKLDFNGDDGVALVKNDNIIDFIGDTLGDPGSAWANNGVSTKDMTLRRKSSISTGDNNPNDAFDPSVEWDGYAKDTTDGLGSHSATCANGTPAPTPTPGGPTPTPAPTPTPTSTPTTNTCSSIPEIQGTGNSSPCLGHRDDIEGCITGVTARGFYFQDVAGDGNPDSSDGIYVYFYKGWSNPSNFQAGQMVRVSGTVTEYYDTTEFANKGSDSLQVTVTDSNADCGGAGLPAPASIAPISDPNADPMTLYERYEGMRVKMSFNGWVVGATKRFISPHPAGDPELAIVDHTSSIPDYARVFQDDYPGYQGITYISGGLGYDLPDLDFGDDVSATDLTGILGYQFDKYTLLVEQTPTLTVIDNEDLITSATPLDAAKKQFDICNFNVENLFDTNDDGMGDWGDWAPGYPVEDSASGLAEYNAKLDALADIFVNRMKSCMVVGVEEVEGQQDVYDALAAKVSAKDPDHTWQAGFVSSGDARNITQGFLWRDDVQKISITPVSGSPYDGWVADGTLDFRRTMPDGLFRFYAGTPEEIDIHFYAVHFKSKRSSNSCNTSDCTDLREKEAADLRDILAHHQAVGDYAIGGGDFNDVLGSSPINILDASNSIKNLFYDLDADQRWSYVFSGESEVLDHIYLTQNLYQKVTPGWGHDFTPIHGNADFPSAERASDHDPVRAIFSRCVAINAPASASAAPSADGQDVNLSWDAVSMSDHYQIWESTAPYFTPDPANDTPLGTATSTSYTHTDGLGNATSNHFYVITAVNPCDASSGLSQRVGEFDFTLIPGSN